MNQLTGLKTVPNDESPPSEESGPQWRSPKLDALQSGLASHLRYDLRLIRPV